MHPQEDLTTLLALRHRGAELSKDIRVVEEALENLIREEISEPRTLTKIREKKAKRAFLEMQLRSLKGARDEILRTTKEIAVSVRKDEAAKVYDAMRISKSGVRGEIRRDIGTNPGP